MFLKMPGYAKSGEKNSQFCVNRLAIDLKVFSGSRRPPCEALEC
jgi:hypothetical protein